MSTTTAFIGTSIRVPADNDGMVRNDDDFAIRPIVVQREGRDNVDFVTRCKAAQVAAHSIDDARNLVADTCRKILDGLDVVVDPPHGFGAVDADRLDLDAHFVRTWGRNMGLDELENLRSFYCAGEAYSAPWKMRRRWLLRLA
jgi:hypothetical protein